MSRWQHIDATTTTALLAEQKADIVDIRDLHSFQSGHIPGARHLSNQNLNDFLAAVPRHRPLIVCCYHGNSSQGAAQFLAEQGYAEVYSLDGGFDAWRLARPVAQETP